MCTEEKKADVDGIEKYVGNPFSKKVVEKKVEAHFALMRSRKKEEKRNASRVSLTQSVSARKVEEEAEKKASGSKKKSRCVLDSFLACFTLFLLSFGKKGGA